VIILVGTWAVIGRGTADRRRLAALGVAFALAMAAGVPLLHALLLSFPRG
jgi:hypothetical protein